MSIASEITRLQGAKADLATAIEGKGVTVPSATKLDGYADLVDAISQGGGGGTMQSKSVSYTPTTSAQSQTVTADAGYDGLSSVAVSVAAMPSGTEGTPTATKGTVSNHSIAVTPSVTNSAGYIEGGTKTGEAVTVSASDVTSGYQIKTANGTYDVTNLASLIVTVPNTYAAGDEGKVVSNGALVSQISDTVTSNDTYDTTLINSLTVNVPGGGGEDREDLTVPKDVDFIDFDGRLVYSYTAQEFLALTALPANPSYPGLVAQGWNWTLVDAKEYVTEWGALVIGQNYTTDDGKTRIYMHLDKVSTHSESATPTLYMVGGASGATCVVDWGDGSIQTVTLTANTFKATTHTYNPYYGDFLVTIEVTSGTLRLGYQGANRTIWDTSYLYRFGVQKIEIGNGVYGYGRNAFHDFWNCKSISVPKTCNNMDKEVDNGIFGTCPQLRGFVFPSGEVGKVGTSFANVSFTTNGATNLRYISLPKSMTKFAMWSYPRQLRKFTMYFLDNDVNRIDFIDASSLTHYIVPGNYTSIIDEPCRSSYITKLTIPGTVTSISNTAFRYNSLLSEVHLKPTTPPTLANINAFGGASANLVFYVPYSADHSILSAYQVATNWSTYASKMQEEPQS